MTKNNKSTKIAIDNIEININDVEHNNCNNYEVGKLLAIFETLVKKAIKLPSDKHLYLLDELAVTWGIPKFAVSIERHTTNETNRLFEETENFDCYVGTFTNEYGDQTLKVTATAFDKKTDQPVYYKGERNLELALGLGDYKNFPLSYRTNYDESKN